jgi:glycosyltransferase involved in cell wall biosynthesis
VKVLHLCFADSHEGGAIGAYRLHRAMLDAGIESRMLVVRKGTDDPTVTCIGLPGRVVNRLYRTASAAILQCQSPKNPSVRSLNIFPTGIHRRINRTDADIVQLHWINRNTISIAEIAKIKKPVVWKLPDMWAFCGTEHYLNPGDRERYREGYKSNNRQDSDRGIDIDRYVWRYKKKCWSNTDFRIICPSKWLATCAQNSSLFGGRKIHNIANPIDLNHYKPSASTGSVRQRYGLSTDKKIVLFGSLFATADRRKGFHHLKKAIALLADHEEINNLELAILGATGPDNTTLSGIAVRYLGSVYGDAELAAVYSEADVMVLPAELDNLPNTIQEAMACGTACVSFDVGGLPDMITHKRTGYLARPYDEADLAKGIAWVLAQAPAALSSEVRASAIETHDPNKRVAQYLEIYSELLAEK